MKVWGYLLLVIGGVVAFVSYFIPVTVETYGEASYLGAQVVNLGKLQLQMMVFQSGITAFLGGAVFIAGGEIAEQLRTLVQPRASETSASAVVPERSPESAVVESTEADREERLAAERAHDARVGRAIWIGFSLVFAIMFLLIAVTWPR